MLCPKCGAKVNPDTLFCSKCGEALSDAKDEKISDTNEFDDTISMKPINLPKERILKDDVRHAEIKKRRPSEIKENTNTVQKNDKKNSQSTVIIILSVVLAIMLVALVVLGINLLSGKNKSSDKDTLKKPETNISENADQDKKTESNKNDEKQEDTTQNMTQEDETKPQSYSTIPIDMVYASTEREDEDMTFPASDAIDSKLSTAWSPSSSNGTGESITLCFSSARKVHGLKISNGYAKTGSDYSKNSRIKSITVKFPDGSICTAELKDNVLSLQTVNFDKEISCQSVTVFIDSIYESEEMLPVYLSEIEVF